MTDLTPEQNGGVTKTILVEGSGESPMTGDTVSVHYVGTLLDSGEKFDSSRDRDQKFEFKLGEGQVIKGWDLGVATMKKGEKCDLICKSEYAYGKGGSPPKIPSDATLKFEVELFDFYGEDVSEDKDKSVLKRTLVKGEGWKTPNDGATLNVEIEGFTVPGNETFGTYSSNSLLHGEEIGVGLPKFMEKVIDDMKSGEKCEITVNEKYAFSGANKVFPNAPLSQPMKFVIDLKSFEKCKESWEMTKEEKIQQSEIKRDSAKRYLEKGEYAMAIKLFEKVVGILEDEVKRPKVMNEDLSDSESEVEGAEKPDGEGDVPAENGVKDDDKTDPKVADIVEASHLNLSLCYLKTRDFTKAMEHCDEVINSHSEVPEARIEKALFRKGECLFLLHDYENAKTLFAEMLQKFPKNATAKKRLYECDQKAKEERALERQRYQRMFNNFST